MADLIELKEAARMLGITPEQLNDLRSQREIHGYRDGTTWKFKQDELDRFASQRDLSLKSIADPDAGGSGIDADLEQLMDVSDLDESPDIDSILVSEQELGGSDVGTASTIIGRGDKPSSADSDIQVASEPTKEGSSKDSDVLSGEPELVPDDASSSGIRLAAGSDVLGEGDASGAVGRAEGDTAELKYADEEDVSMGGEPLELSDDLSLSGVEDLELEGISDLDLGREVEDNADQVLDSGTGSDVTLSGDSGINLSSPIDSGLSLEAPLDLTGSDAESLELGEADIELDEEADPDQATQLKADDDFLLTPIEGPDGDDADTGSQVIALDTEEFDETADTMLHQGASPLLADADLLTEAEADLEEGEMPTSSPLVPQMGMLPEASYSVVNVLSLLLIVVVLGVTGVMMADMVRNIWSWDQPTTFSSTLMDSVLKIFD